jgi:tight adherence protein B
MWASLRRQRRQKRFTAQLPDTLDYLARSLRAGNPFSASLKAVSRDMPDPIGGELGKTFDEMNYGLDLDDALHNLSARAGNQELDYFITAVLIQRSTGGNLAEVFNRISNVLRSRARMHKEIEIQAGEMKFSARVLIALPFVVAGVVSILNPKYLLVLTQHPVGLVLIGIQILLMVIGYLIMRKMINFKV